MISARGGVVANSRACSIAIFWCILPYNVESNTWDNPANNEDNEQQLAKSYARVYDRTFGLADGLKSKSWSVQQPFDAITPKSGQLALETPQAAASTTLGLNPVTVAAPNTVSSPPVNPVTVTPPVASPPTVTPPNNGSSTPPAPQATPAAQSTPQASSTPVSSNPSPTITAPPIGTTTPAPSSNPSPATSSPAAQPIALPAPVNTLPSAVSSAVSPTSVQSPLSSSVPIVNPITITAPNQVTPPIVGSSSAVSVVAPVSSVPVNPITVKPPSSAVKPVTSSSAPPRIAILDYWKDGKVGGTCIEDDIGTPRGSGCSTKNLQDEADRLEEEAKRANSERERIAALERLNLVLARIQDTKFFGSTSISAEAALKRIFKTPTYQNATPARQLALLTVTADGLTSGELGGCDLKVFAGALEGINASRPVTINLIGSSGTTSSGCKPTTRPASANPNANQGGAIPMGGGFRPRANSWRPSIARPFEPPRGGGGGLAGLALLALAIGVAVILDSNDDGNSNSNPQAQPNSQAAQGSPDPEDPCGGNKSGDTIRRTLDEVAKSGKSPEEMRAMLEKLLNDRLGSNSWKATVYLDEAGRVIATGQAATTVAVIDRNGIPRYGDLNTAAQQAVGNNDARNALDYLPESRCK